MRSARIPPHVAVVVQGADAFLSSVDLYRTNVAEKYEKLKQLHDGRIGRFNDAEGIPVAMDDDHRLQELFEARKLHYGHQDLVRRMHLVNQDIRDKFRDRPLATMFTRLEYSSTLDKFFVTYENRNDDRLSDTFLFGINPSAATKPAEDVKVLSDADAAGMARILLSEKATPDEMSTLINQGFTAASSFGSRRRSSRPRDREEY
jgi:hypothetical protein